MHSHLDGSASHHCEENTERNSPTGREGTSRSASEPWASLSNPEEVEGLSWGALGEVGGTLLKVSQQIAKTLWASEREGSSAQQGENPGSAEPGNTARLLEDPESLLDGWGKMLDLLQREPLQESPSETNRQTPSASPGKKSSPHRKSFEYIENPALSSTRKRILESRGVDLNSGPVVSVGSGFRTLRGPRAFHNVERELAYRYRFQEKQVPGKSQTTSGENR